MKLIDYKNPLLNNRLSDIENTDIDELQKLANEMYAFVDQQGGAGL